MNIDVNKRRSGAVLKIIGFIFAAVGALMTIWGIVHIGVVPEGYYCGEAVVTEISGNLLTVEMNIGGAEYYSIPMNIEVENPKDCSNGDKVSLYYDPDSQTDSYLIIRTDHQNMVILGFALMIASAAFLAFGAYKYSQCGYKLIQISLGAIIMLFTFSSLWTFWFDNAWYLLHSYNSNLRVFLEDLTDHYSELLYSAVLIPAGAVLVINGAVKRRFYLSKNYGRIIEADVLFIVSKEAVGKMRTYNIAASYTDEKGKTHIFKAKRKAFHIPQLKTVRVFVYGNGWHNYYIETDIYNSYL